MKSMQELSDGLDLMGGELDRIGEELESIRLKLGALVLAALRDAE